MRATLIASPLMVAIATCVIVYWCGANGIRYTNGLLPLFVLGAFAASLLLGFGTLMSTRTISWWKRILVCLGYLVLVPFVLILMGF